MKITNKPNCEFSEQVNVAIKDTSVRVAMSKISLALIKYMRDNNYTPQEFADLLGISADRLTSVLRGTCYKTITMIEIFRYLDVIGLKIELTISENE